MPNRDIHVVPHKEGWATKKEGAIRASSLHSTKADAMKQGREQARREHVELVIHGKNGRIQDSDSYGNDPRRSHDTKH